jgi:23S rRNA (cytosine1962-C5)-methyltransferase
VTAPLPQVELPRSLARPLALGHPWIYRDHVPAGFTAPAGSWVEVRAGAVRAFALWDPASPLALRVYSRERPPDERLVQERVHAALALREAVGLPARATAYRWLAGEGDGVPGIVVDRYGPYAVLATDGDGFGAVIPWVVAALRRAPDLRGIVGRARGSHGDDAPERRFEVLWGKPPPDDLVVEEYGLRFRANLAHGQKTGLFLDQRENRRAMEGVANGRRVLNLYGYTGGFSLFVLRGGATHVTTVDQGARALDDARKNFTLNGFDPDAHDFVAGDALEYLHAAREKGEEFDLVISDPPSFARSRGQRDRARRAYAKLHAAALSVTARGGLYAASSCTTQIGVDSFRETLAEGAERVGVVLRTILDAGHGPDHPVLAAHPEGRYLKFILSYVES